MTDENEIGKAEIFRLAGSIVTAHVTNNIVPASDLARLIGSVHEALSIAAISSFVAVEPAAAEPLPALTHDEPAAEPVEREPAPAPVSAPVPILPIEESVTHEAIICLDCGRALKVLKHHLKSAHETDFARYRAKWKLPKNYPFVAPAYSERLSANATKPGGAVERMTAARGQVLKPREAAPEPEPPVDLAAESVHPDHLTCLECRKNLTTLTLHLRQRHGLTPDSYRAKWKLPGDYPMSAPSLTAAKSETAKKSNNAAKARAALAAKRELVLTEPAKPTRMALVGK